MKNIHFLIIGLFISYNTVAQSFDLNSVINKVYNYEMNDGKGNTTLCDTKFNWANISGTKYSHYIFSGKDFSWNVTGSADGKPKEVIFKAGKDSITLRFNGEGLVICTGSWKNKKISESKKFRANVSMENMLVLQTLDFNKKGKYIFDLIQYDKLPDIIAYRMYFKVRGNETITTSAGTFKCKKIEFSIDDFRSIFYKAYYWITDDSKRLMVKVDNVPAMTGKTVLKSIQ